jgi:hypothetical protein
MLLLSPNPAATPPYEQRFVFTLDFSEPGSALPGADRLTYLFLPSTEFPTRMLTLHPRQPRCPSPSTWHHP